MKNKICGLLAICLVLVSCMSTSSKFQRERERDPRYQYNLGLYYLNNNQVDDAILHFNNALKLNPDYSLALNAMGQAYWMKGKIQDSINFFERCLEVNPALTEAHNNLGVSYQEIGQLDRAEVEFRKVIADTAYKSRELAYYNLARLYIQKDRIQDALFYTQKALDLNSTFVMALGLKGELCLRTEEYETAIAAYTKALDIAEEDVNLLYNLAVAFFKNGDLRKAEEIFMNISTRAVDAEMKKSIDGYLAEIRKAPRSSFKAEQSNSIRWSDPDGELT